MSASSYWLQLPDESGPIPIEIVDRTLADRIGRLLEDGGSVSMKIAAGPEADTVGHAAGTVAVTAMIADDVEGHTLSLRFANPAQAIEFQKRLIVTGAIVATVAVGAVGAASVSSPAQDARVGTAPAPGPAITVTIDRPARSGPLAEDPGPAPAAASIVESIAAPGAADASAESAAGPSSLDLRRSAVPAAASTGGAEAVEIDRPAWSGSLEQDP
jgi:hypothetical protein